VDGGVREVKGNTNERPQLLPPVKTHHTLPSYLPFLSSGLSSPLEKQKRDDIARSVLVGSPGLSPIPYLLMLNSGEEINEFPVRSELNRE
jgi:hypothetical protein